MSGTRHVSVVNRPRTILLDLLNPVVDQRFEGNDYTSLYLFVVDIG